MGGALGALCAANDRQHACMHAVCNSLAFRMRAHTSPCPYTQTTRVSKRKQVERCQTQTHSLTHAHTRFARPTSGFDAATKSLTKIASLSCSPPPCLTARLLAAGPSSSRPLTGWLVRTTCTASGPLSSTTATRRSRATCHSPTHSGAHSCSRLSWSTPHSPRAPAPAAAHQP